MLLIRPPLESLPLKTQPNGCILYVKVSPKASKTAIGSIEPGQFHPVLKVFVKEPALDGKANDAVIDLIAEHFKCQRRSVTMQSGHTQKLKTLFIEGISMDAMIQKLPI